MLVAGLLNMIGEAIPEPKMIFPNGSLGYFQRVFHMFYEFHHVCKEGLLVGGFNPLEKYQSKWESSPNRGENKKYLKPPPRLLPYHQFVEQMVATTSSGVFLPNEPGKKNGLTFQNTRCLIEILIKRKINYNPRGTG